MELYQREAAKGIRERGSSLSILSEQALVSFWGIYSCESHNCFWVEAEAEAIYNFLRWAGKSSMVAREIAKAQRAASFRKEERAEARQLRPRPRFIVGWDSQRIADPRIHAGDVRPAPVRKVAREPLMTVHELSDSINRWCEQQGVAPTTPGSKLAVDEPMVRYCCKYGLLDRPGSPADGRQVGFSQKHACQLRVIRLLQARSLSLSDINTIMHGRQMPDLLEIEREELAVLKRLPLAPEDSAPRARHGTPRWA